MSKQKTTHFQNCLGVFQGGGCKAIAFAGAYEEAVSRNVFFSEVAGTSAGAIVAVFIGAGASPTQLNEIMERLDFNRFMGKPKPYSGAKIFSGRTLARLIPHRKARNYIRHYGFYSADYINVWVNEELASLLDIQGRPVLFSDLNIPTTVVATDLNTQTVKIWSNNKSPEQEVGKAVQTSCSIPFYFQPFEKRFIDGGMVSNLPSFLMKSGSIFNRVLAFGFKKTDMNSEISGGADLFKRVLFSAIDGATDIQLALQENMSVIKIDTGGIEATDFDKITKETKEKLIKNGQEATSVFFENESVNVKKVGRNEDIGFDSTETFNLLIKSSRHPRKEILISDDKGIWIYSLFALLVKWKKDNSQVRVLLKKNSESIEHREYKIRLLKHFGFSILEIETLPFKGFIFDGEKVDGCAVIYNEVEAEFDSKYYSGNEDYPYLQRLKKEFDVILPVGEIEKSETLQVREIPESEIIEKLKQVKQYNSDKIEIVYEEINVHDVFFLTKYLKGYKYRLVDNLFKMYIDSNLEICRPAAFKFGNDKKLIITPPILEKHGDSYFVIEGNARIVYASKNNIDKIGAMIIKNVTDPMPSTGNHTIKKVIVSDVSKEGDNRYLGFDKEHFRRIEETVRNPKTSLV